MLRTYIITNNLHKANLLKTFNFNFVESPLIRIIDYFYLSFIENKFTDNKLMIRANFYKANHVYCIQKRPFKLKQIIKHKQLPFLFIILIQCV